MRRLALVLLLGNLLVRPVAAQLTVVDLITENQTTISAIQNVITAAQMVISTANQALELKKLDSIAVAADMAADMQELLLILQDARGLLHDIGSLQVLFDASPANLPKTLPAMRAKVTAMDESIKNARTYALKAQRLVTILQSTTWHLTGLVDGISGFVGNKQGNQSIAQQEAVINKSLGVLTTQAAAQQRTDTLERMRTAVIVAMDKEIRRQYWLPYFDIGTD
jgi:hypothetical protein